jgi:hypothetical protein
MAASRLFGVVCATVASLGLVAPAHAIGSEVPGEYICRSEVAIPGGGSGVALADPVTLVTTIQADPTYPSGSVASVDVHIEAAPSASMPVSPGVPLTDVTLTQLDVKLDIYMTGSNSPASISGPPDDAALGSLPISTSLGTLSPRTELPPVDISGVELPGAAVGTRQWLRVKSFSYQWTAAAGISGATTCRLIGPIREAGAGGTVTQPLYGVGTDLSAQYPESATYFVAGSARFSDFAARTRVVDALSSPGPTASACTVTSPSGCPIGAIIEADIVAGSLTQQTATASGNPSSTAVRLRQRDATPRVAPYDGDPFVTVSSASQVMEGPLNPVTVTDVRGGSAGWSLTAGLSGPLVGSTGGAIAANNASIVGATCTPIPGSASHTPGDGGQLGSAVTLCTVDAGVDDSDGESGSGQYVVRGTIELEVPAFQLAGDYTSTLVVTLA